MKGNLEGFPLILVGNKCDEESGVNKSSKALLSILLAILWFAGERKSGGVSSHPGREQV